LECRQLIEFQPDEGWPLTSLGENNFAMKGNYFGRLLLSLAPKTFVFYLVQWNAICSEV
jgi:hypothetical protein